MRYRLPKALGEGECTVADDRWYGPDRYVRATIGEGEDAFTIDLDWRLLTPVAPPLPDEPPIGTVLLDRADMAWQRFTEPTGTRQWYPTSGESILDWEKLQDEGPLTRLVPDPFAEPVELPWKSLRGLEVSQTRTDTGMGDQVYVSTKGASYGFAHVDPAVARDMARALMTAADAAEKESS